MFTFTVTAAVSIFAPTKGLWALSVVPRMAKRRARLVSREAAGNGTDAVEEDERGSGCGTRAGYLK